MYKFKLNRAPGRWQYKTTQKPRVTIRKQNEEEPKVADSSGLDPVLTPQDSQVSQSRSDELDLNPLGSEQSTANLNDDKVTDNKLEPNYPLETIKVEISTPADFNSIYYELATIKSPYTFQVNLKII